jgi:ribosomal protein S18 acetylase RimI-like enzyme
MIDPTFAAGIRPLQRNRGDQVVARVGIGSREGFAGAPGVTGFVGWYEATDGEAGTNLLGEAVAALYRSGADRVIGPLDGSTWQRYRLLLPDESARVDVEPPFLGEPTNPAEYPLHFAAAGFAPHLEYESRIVDRPAASPEAAAARERLLVRGIRVEGIDPSAFDRTIAEIHGLTHLAFAENPYFTPLDPAAFGAMYAAVRPLVDPALVRLARDAEGHLLGFVFAYVDPYVRGRVVLKTLASHPDARGLGLGGVLTDEVNAAAGARGAAVIHALMQVTNFSRRISARSESRLLRSYRLYSAPRP